MAEEALRAMTRRANTSRSKRTALIRHAYKEYLRTLEEEELFRRYVEGYR